jgi:hypothetical protein
VQFLSCSCESNDYLAFALTGIIGVLAVPIGIPASTLLLLLQVSPESTCTCLAGIQNVI